MAIIGTPKALSVKTMLEMSLTIPDYQRPYKWQSNHVNQLLEDIIFHKSKNCYRLGTVVLHEEKQNGAVQLNIVDGQQRLLTLTLLSVILDKEKQFKPKLLQHEFNSPTTIRNLKHNAAIIESRCKQLSKSEREELVDFLMHKCELICIHLDNLSEAFQFFDSQNARGKELEPYDLLKAFHLREMGNDSEEERIKCVTQWESEVSPDNSEILSLHDIMSDYLFRIRRWVQAESGASFTKNNIHVFKGIDLKTNSYRFTAPLRALDYMVDKYNGDSIRQWDLQEMPYPFQIDQTVLNGKRFFEFIQHYIFIYQKLFSGKTEALKKLLNVINSSEGKTRVGDRYVKNLFYCSVLYYYDKFGDVELEKAANLCFVWSYTIRLNQYSVPIESIDSHARNNRGVFSIIKKSLHPHEVLSMSIEPVEKTKIKGTKVDKLVQMFNKLGYHLK